MKKIVKLLNDYFDPDPLLLQTFFNKCQPSDENKIIIVFSDS